MHARTTAHAGEPHHCTHAQYWDGCRAPVRPRAQPALRQAARPPQPSAPTRPGPRPGASAQARPPVHPLPLLPYPRLPALPGRSASVPAHGSTWPNALSILCLNRQPSAQLKDNAARSTKQHPDKQAASWTQGTAESTRGCKTGNSIVYSAGVTDLCHQPTQRAPRLAEGLAQAGVHARREQRQRLPCQRGVRAQRLGRRSAPGTTRVRSCSVQRRAHSTLVLRVHLTPSYGFALPLMRGKRTMLRYEVVGWLLCVI